MLLINLNDFPNLPEPIEKCPLRKNYYMLNYEITGQQNYNKITGKRINYSRGTNSKTGGRHFTISLWSQ